MKWQNIIKDDTGKAVYRRRLASIKEGKSPFEELEGLLMEYDKEEMYEFGKVRGLGEEVWQDMIELKKKFIKYLEERIKVEEEEYDDDESDVDSEHEMMREREGQGGYGGWNDAY